MFRYEPDFNYFTTTCCALCSQEMTFDETQKEENENIRFAFFDSKLNKPLCSYECLQQFEEENGWEYEQQLQKQG